MQDGSRQQGQGIVFATNSFTKQDCIFLAKILTDKYGLKLVLLKQGFRIKPDPCLQPAAGRAIPKLPLAFAYPLRGAKTKGRRENSPPPNPVTPPQVSFGFCLCKSQRQKGEGDGGEKNKYTKRIYPLPLANTKGKGQLR